MTSADVMPETVSDAWDEVDASRELEARLPMAVRTTRRDLLSEAVNARPRPGERPTTRRLGRTVP